MVYRTWLQRSSRVEPGLYSECTDSHDFIALVFSLGWMAKVIFVSKHKGFQRMGLDWNDGNSRSDNTLAN